MRRLTGACRLSKIFLMNQDSLIKPFCLAPWHSMSVTPSGQITPCCMIPADLGNLNEGTLLQEAWHGKPLRDFRQDLLDGRLSPACRECKSKEDLGIYSLRSSFEWMTKWRSVGSSFASIVSEDQIFNSTSL